MTERKDLWWVAPASLALIVLIFVSGAGNFQYGLAFGGPIIGGASIASDLFKIVALIGVFALWRNRHRFQAAALFVLFLGFTAWSMLSAVGFMSTQFATLEDNRGKTASQWQTLTAQIEQLQERRSQVNAARPQKTIQADIDAILRIPGVNGCAVIDGPVTRANCPKLSELRAELGHAEAAVWLDGRLDELRKELATTDRVSVIDPRTDSITALSGLAVSSVALFIKFFFAGLIELATAVGLWAIWSPVFGKRGDVTRPAEKPQEPAKASTVPSPRGGTKQPVLGEQWSEKRASFGDRSERPIELPKPHAPSVVVDNTSKATRKPSITGSVKSWKGERLVPTKFGGSTTAALHDDYVAWCRQHGYTALHKGPFGKKLGQLGLKREGKQKGAWRPGWDLRKTEVGHRAAVAA